MERDWFTASTDSGDISGWCTGDGPPVLALHGGPALGFEYLDPAVEELAAHHRVATFQQRGLAPSTLDGEFTLAEAVRDVEAVLDELGWDAVHVMGHSWGGHLALHAAVAIPDRLAGVLAVDPMGAVGDGGTAEFLAALVDRMDTRGRPRLDELDAKESSEGLTVEEELEQLALVWPSYFADPASAPPMPTTRISQAAYRGLAPDTEARLPELEAALPSIRVPVGVLLGEGSPIPLGSGTETAERIPGAWCEVVAGAGHFIWHEEPGAVLAAMGRLVAPAR